METITSASNSPPAVQTKRKATDSSRGRSKKARRSASPPTSDTEDSNNSDTESPIPQGPTPLTPLTPSSPPKYPSDLKTHHCPYTNCPKSFNRPARLTEHLRSHTNERPFNCKHIGCSKTFLRETHLSHHVKSAHTSVRDFVCDRAGCGKKFLTATRLRRHHAAHDGRDKYRCTLHPPCTATFRKHATLQKHVASVHMLQKPYPCTQLDEVTGRLCTLGFETAGKRRAHEGRMHGGGARFWCSECTHASTPDELDAPQLQTPGPGLGFPTYALLQSHLRTAHPPTCPHCATTCPTARDLAQHIEIHHDDGGGGAGLAGRKTHRCTYADCGRAFTKKGNLAIHVRAVHEGERRFVCGETDLSASRGLGGWDMRAGPEAGEGEGACGARFASKGNLEEHVRGVHLRLAGPGRAGRKGSVAKEKGRKRGSKASQPSVLGRLTGAGYGAETGRHFVCPEARCAYRFFRTYDLELHLRTHHGLVEGRGGLLMDGSGGLLLRDSMSGMIRAGSGYVDDGDEAAERELSGAFGWDVERELERMAGLGGEFWVGGLGGGGGGGMVGGGDGGGMVGGGDGDGMVGGEEVEEALVWGGADEEEEGGQEGEENIDPVLRYLDTDGGLAEEK